MKTNCLYCNNEFDAPDREVKRGNGKFCCQSHSSKYFSLIRSRTLEKNVTCSYCGKAFHKAPNRLTQSKSRLYFCCREHKDLAQRIGGIKAIQPDHYKDGTREYRLQAFRNLPNYCNRCGYDKHIAALVVHHKDRDRSNGNITNLEILCSNCHAIEHWSK